MLDRKLIRTTQHPRGFEACDIITPNGDLIYVKHISRSSPASHLFNQVIVATDALLHDNEARQQLRELVTCIDDGATRVPRSVILGLARPKSKRVTATNLSNFSQVTLARLDTLLAAANIKLTIAPIDRVNKKQSEPRS